MRIDLEPVLAQAQTLITAIEAQSQSRASHAAHVLLGILPDPTWAETAPGCLIYYGDERDVDAALNVLRRHAMTWLGWLTEERAPSDEWPKPKRLAEAIQSLEAFTPQNASVSANTAPTMS